MKLIIENNYHNAKIWKTGKI